MLLSEIEGGGYNSPAKTINEGVNAFCAGIGINAVFLSFYCSIGYCILIVQGIKSLTLRLNPSHPHPSHPHSITNSNSSTTPPHSLTRLQSSHPHSPTKSPPPPPSHPHSPVLFYVCVMLVALFSLRTMARNPVWHTRESLFKYVHISSLLSPQTMSRLHF